MATFGSSLLLLSSDEIQARFAHAHLLRDLHLWYLGLVLSARTAEELSARPAVVAALVDGELHPTAQTRLGGPIFAPVINHPWKRED